MTYKNTIITTLFLVGATVVLFAENGTVKKPHPDYYVIDFEKNPLAKAIDTNNWNEALKIINSEKQSGNDLRKSCLIIVLLKLLCGGSGTKVASGKNLDEVRELMTVYADKIYSIIIKNTLAKNPDEICRATATLLADVKIDYATLDATIGQFLELEAILPQLVDKSGR